MKSAFIAGSTGYLGSRLAGQLLNIGYTVEALVRPGSERRVPPGCKIISGDALDPESYQRSISSDTFVHLVGVSNPNPAKADLFRKIDLPAAIASFAAAQEANVKHFVYVSVAHPAPVMKAYVQTRMEAEAKLLELGLPATILRPWYVLGPGHRWAYALIPLYEIFERISFTRESALRCGLVTLKQMLAALVHAVETPVPNGVRILEVPDIRKHSSPAGGSPPRLR